MSDQKMRFNYHPKVDEELHPRKKGQRDMRARLDLLVQEVDFKDKVVLDLGCSGGFFSLSLARYAKRVIAIDGDENIIDRNKSEAKRLGIDNVEFYCSKITPQLIDDLPEIDVTIFMSVLHHMLGASKIYDWCAPQGKNQARELLKSIQCRSQVLIFEMGEFVSQKEEWEVFLKNTMGNLNEWILKEVFDSRFHFVKEYSGVAYKRWPFTWCPSLSRWAQATKLGRAFCHQTGIDRRDFRTIYIGRN